MRHTLSDAISRIVIDIHDVVTSSTGIVEECMCVYLFQQDGSTVVYAYARVSTEVQRDNGVSLASQVNACELLRYTL